MNYRGLSIPLTQMGSGVITSDDLFGPNEQVIFDFYEANASRYKRALDVGANIGVHSILMSRLGWSVRAFEPDPVHFYRLVKNVVAHSAWTVSVTNAAVSDRHGEAWFVRVLQNTTGSHLDGAKKNVYGATRRMKVQVKDCRPLFAWADFAKIDCEGHEAVLVCATERWGKPLEAMLEVGSPENARRIYDHLIGAAPMWAQKVGWRRVEVLGDMPTSHREGSLFIGTSPPFPTSSPV